MGPLGEQTLWVLNFTRKGKRIVYAKKLMIDDTPPLHESNTNFNTIIYPGLLGYFWRGLMGRE
jgi:hypothetical protein